MEEIKPNGLPGSCNCLQLPDILHVGFTRKCNLLTTIPSWEYCYLYGNFQFAISRWKSSCIISIPWMVAFHLMSLRKSKLNFKLLHPLSWYMQLRYAKPQDCPQVCYIVATWVTCFITYKECVGKFLVQIKHQITFLYD